MGAVSGGYDSAAQAPRFLSFAEARVYGPFALRTAVTTNVGGEALRPSVAARAQFLDQQRHGVSAAAVVAFKAEGFIEPEGEIEATLSVGRRFDRTLLIAISFTGKIRKRASATPAVAATSTRHARSAPPRLEGALVGAQDVACKDFVLRTLL